MIKKYLFLYLFFIKQLFCLEHFFISQNQNYKFNLSFLDDIKLKYKKFENNLFFDRNFIVDIKKVKDFCKSLPEHSEFKVLTKDNQEIDVSFFNRNSDKLIFIGPGFSNQKEKLIPFVAMFPDYDVVIINFRGHVLNKLGINLQTSLGDKEEQDIIAVINYINTNFNKYKSKIGIGICFGGYNMVKAQALAEKNNEQLFDALIIDGCCLSIDQSIDVLCSDPGLIFNPQKGGSNFFTKLIVGSDLIKYLIKNLIEYLLGIDIKSLDSAQWFSCIKETPVLFIHSRPDLVISWDSFISIYNSCNSKNKAAWITPNAHVINHLKSKEIYAYLVEQIINNRFLIDIIQEITHPENTILSQ